MLELDDTIADLLRRQHGIVTITQLEAAGHSRTAIDKMQRHGLLELVLHGAYRLRGVEPSLIGDCAAVCLAHPAVAIAGPTAGRLWELRRLPTEARIVDAGGLRRPVHVLAPPGARPTVRRWVKVYRTAAVHADDVIDRDDGIRITSRPRTALDLARFVDPRDLLSIVEQVRVDGPHTVDELRAVALDWRSPRRRWVDTYLQTVDRMLPGGGAESHPEVLVGEALAAQGVAGVVRQHRVDLPGHGAVRFDLAVPELRWAIEVDVFPTHRETDGHRRDQERDAACARLGWTVTRIGPDDLGPALPSTIEHLVAIFRARSSGASTRPLR